MATKKSLMMLDTCAQKIADIVNKSQLGPKSAPQPLSVLFNNVKSGQIELKHESVLTLATKGDPKARSSILQMIYTELTGTLHLSVQNVDDILSGYYINYYGTVEDLSSSTYIKPFVDLINRSNILLNKKNATKHDKFMKLAQVVFQELYGIGVLDEFLNISPDENLVKVEEVASAGSNQFSLKVSGLNVKLDGIYYPQDKIDQITKRLAKCSGKGLNYRNNVIETELLDGSRVTLMCPPFTACTTFNIRRHYPNSITITKKVELGSTTWQYEKFLDLLMLFKPRIVIIGPQGGGKSTVLRELVNRYPKNTTLSGAETSFELGLEKLPGKIVNRFRAGLKDVDDFIAPLFRVNADALILGEARTPQDAMLYVQLSERQAYGTITTWHAVNPLEFISQFSGALLRGGYVTNEREARVLTCDCVDIIINIGICDESFGDYAGLRHTISVTEVPRISLSEADNIKLNTLFEYDYNDMYFKKKNSLSEKFLELCLKRHFDPEKLERLKNGSYL